VNTERLCICLQPLEGARWRWWVKYPAGTVCKTGESDTLADAASTAAVVLEVIEERSR